MATISDDLAAKLTAAFNQSTIDIANQDALLAGTGNVTVTMGDGTKKSVASWALMQANTLGKANTGSANSFSGSQSSDTSWIVTGGGGSGNGIISGTGDSASYDNCNMDFASWQGIGFYNTSTGGLGKGRTGYFNTRVGSFTMKGTLTAGAAVINGQLSATSVVLTNALPVAQGGTGGTTASTARKSLALDYLTSFAGTTEPRVLSYDDSGLMLIARTITGPAVAAGATVAWSWNFTNELGVSFANIPCHQVSLLTGQSVLMYLGVEGLSANVISGFIKNSSGAAVTPKISVLLIGKKG